MIPRCIFYAFAFLTTSTLVSSRAVNISNTWMLPEEGFPVFYRYFRDRISWYEADAVCQFHHANLVTADSSSQYDAIRAYLKELDITENVWIGLSKASERPNFTWTDLRALTGDGHWEQSVPETNDALCVVMDPADDFLWKPLPCGGPQVASFICELPVPSWAVGPKGCLLTELPSLTVLYIPEQLALELTSDCGLDGTKRIACKGNANREEILKQLSCAVPDEEFDGSTKNPLISSEEPAKTTKSWIWTSNTIDIDYGMPTRHRRETEDTLSPMASTKSTKDLAKDKPTTTVEPDMKPDLSSTQNTDLSTPQQDLFTTETASISSAADFDVEDTGEYPAAIGQGQLFSIIENGTMFDIIELNETTSSSDGNNAKVSKDDHIKEHPLLSSTIETLKASSDSLYTTVSYQKEPPSDATFVTNKSVKKTETKHTKKPILKEKEYKKVAISEAKNKSVTDEKTHSKEVEMFPIMTGPMVKLNRTNRKQLPILTEQELVENGTDFGAPQLLNVTNNQPENQQTSSTTQKTILVTTKATTTEEAKEYLPKSLLGESNLTQIIESSEALMSPSEEPLEPEPEAQPRPNRQRQLTRPQRRSFYPYFFSRVLG